MLLKRYMYVYIYIHVKLDRESDELIHINTQNLFDIFQNENL